MIGFDAERYLRVTGEQVLLDRKGPLPWEDRLWEVSKALLAICRLDVPTAKRVCGEYALAQTLRGSARFHPPSPATGPLPVSAPPSPRRMIACRRAIRQPWGQLIVKFVSLTEDKSTLAVTLLTEGPRPRPGLRTAFGPGHALAPWVHAGPQALTIADDRGTVASADFSGGGSDVEWNGQFTTRPALARDTTWIELLGERLLLDADVPAIEVTVRPVLGDPARRYLWHRIARSRTPPRLSPQPRGDCGRPGGRRGLGRG